MRYYFVQFIYIKPTITNDINFITLKLFKYNTI